MGGGVVGGRDVLGVLVVVTPLPEHLQELKQSILHLDETQKNWLLWLFRSAAAKSVSHGEYRFVPLR